MGFIALRYYNSRLFNEFKNKIKCITTCSAVYWNWLNRSTITY